MKRRRSVRTARLSSARATDLAELFRVLGDATRLRILAELARGKARVGDLATRVGASQATSQSLAVLRRLPLATVQETGQVAYHSLDERDGTAIFHVILQLAGGKSPLRMDPGRRGTRKSRAASATGRRQFTT